MSALLEVSGLHAGYGDSEVLQGLDFELGKGEVVCLLGANGVGKTTTMGVLSGLVPASEGRVRYDGVDLLAMPSHERVKSGLALSPEGRKVFPNLTVEENLYLGSFNRNARAHRMRKLDEVYALFPRLAERRMQSSGLMSGGEQQMLALGRALMSNPRVLLLDEPSLGLAPLVVQAVFAAIRAIAATNISILLVEQNTHAALSVASRGYVMAGGRIVHAGDAATLREAPELRDAFIGGNAARNPSARNGEALHA
ncbi:ABC transporter ATP-binding protein [Xanthobacter pseudotagetidis]|uniref:ABC transporter ATP-binding protein n=1 Tax=Xanthobacter pseudotagetidis TaxID=3119911 RepID=UPI003728DDFF